MSKKKDIQAHLISKKNDKVTEEEFFSVLRSIAPGTNFRTALMGALKIGKGALVVVDNKSLEGLMDGGFKINAKFTPQKLMELAKMDGSIILSRDLKKIEFANVLLTPNSNIKTNETGTRHKAAERVAKQANTLTVAISERRSEITLYYKNLKYVLEDSETILRKANENIQVLEKQRNLFDNYLEKLNRTEIHESTNLQSAIDLIQKGMLVQKIAEDLKKYTIELGKEGTLLKIRLNEIKGGVEKETDLIMKDYTLLDLKKSKAMIESLSYEELLDDKNILKALFYEDRSRTDPIKGWRILSKTSCNEKEISQIIKVSPSLPEILNASPEKFYSVFEKEKAEKIVEELNKLKINY